MKTWLNVLIVFMIFAGCSKQQIRTTTGLPPIYPDYTNVTIPCNIAPLNFGLTGNFDAIQARISSANESVVITGKTTLEIPIRKWQQLLNRAQGSSLSVQVEATRADTVFQFQSFQWHISSDPIDPYLSYRLIEPGYEVWNKIQLEERCMENFTIRTLADNNLVEGSCMNCHIYGNQDPDLSMFHLRGKKGGTILNQAGQLRKITTKTDSMISNAVYGNFHPSGKYAVFSTNIIIPEIHAYKNRRLEVYDSKSDLVILNFDNNTQFTAASIANPQAFETFPTFSADGRSIYFCSAPALQLPDSIEQLKYSILKVTFNSDQTIGMFCDTIWNARETQQSASHLKCSPDGRFLLYTVADYGTFPIWHREAELELMDLSSGQSIDLSQVNGPNADSYHSWASNSRWFVFASKRDDGIYGKPYFAHISSKGEVSKPFVLPQKNPDYYRYTLKSFNIPELAKGQVPFNAGDIEQIYHETPAEVVQYVEPNYTP